MRFGILGETRAWRDDGAEVPLGGPARRALLALLLARPGEVVSSDRLAGELDPGGGLSAHALQSQVSRLRTALGPAAAIERAGAGYRIVVAPEDVDACRFERLAREGRAALGDGDAGRCDPGRAVALLREALGLWRGPALAEVAESETARAAAVRLEELKLRALEDRIEGELRLGEHGAAVPELRELVGRHPLRERPAGLLIRALFAGGGQAEALMVFEETRRHLAEELGADPSAELAALHRELLSAAPSPSPVAPPAQLTSFVGRAEEVTEVAELLRVARLVTLIGPGGVGKTRLSVEVAGVAADEVCFVALAPLRDGSGLPQALLGALGLRENGLQLGSGPRTPVERLITALSDRMLLLVLDNCEHVVEETAVLAARLLAACPRLRVLATSREPLGVIGEHVRQVRPLADEAAIRSPTGPAPYGAASPPTPDSYGASAPPSTICRWPSNSRRHGCAHSTSTTSRAGWTTGSGSRPVAAVRPTSGAGRCARWSPGAGTCCRSPSSGPHVASRCSPTARRPRPRCECAARTAKRWSRWPTSRSWTPRAAGATGCWRPSAPTAPSGLMRRANASRHGAPTPGTSWSWRGPPTRT
ncbi:hypothetical protein SBI_05652 [Streptomyces bingchenggensis BCW-1]|uniref:OmpR/PhoB-type domain-containing protein n=1 Tax=Streptomyces bingchenggensis (strain BCW-1) TaxID=749414 RepID=D7CCP1_STRBB|nr:MULTISPECIES: BTAD domain-containing putative transcriptional regulator [Streptomyces]ADI08772.1 hypothetical protein SBI_05652 [Streptomyces bingchenggensis BCW-1]